MLLTIGFVDKENKEALNISVIDRVVNVSFTAPNKIEFVRLNDEGKTTRMGVETGYVWFGVHLDGTDLGNLHVEKAHQEENSDE